ncbi:heat-inducible transcription repressor HrcA [Acidothermus cellulolyticus 11B]|uniref:Heat-inducible transcription repressor HrcA n=1 Tax=Acidothermus cellulolyticus (strain ATCC 43068 / DSM 8971 / 11B) TaxID=351607 RepID=HRCA_ACIC1|nr:heat-inducible transcriptional repressor HrcA [Acidothermus cellulolyticus]A0LSZ6.1 RecName: Full=Heat-inducible transcription repressor HrcA [Acidothermus cellulolyticus 11B]ABK52556.1 heat-inducible transcription repressor HrcA [Acidothermus cellulolyticus 11B]
MLDERKLEVLRAIVEDFVSTNEPVGSKALVERHHLKVSPATVRNDMAALEDEGYIVQPHTSAGRVPTKKGYRLFVDRLSTIKPLSVAERRAIEHFLAGAVDLDDVISRTVRLLAQLTRQVAVVQYPTLDRSAVRHLELIRLSGTRVLLVVITDTGRVEQRQIDLPGELEETDTAELRNRLNAAIAGKRVVDVPDLLATFADGEPPARRSAATAIVSAVLDALVIRRDERVVVGGAANLARFPTDFPESVQPVLEALEEQVVLIRLLGEATRPSEVLVRIGEEDVHEGLRSTAVVSSAYGSKGRALASLGVVGPMRMDYPTTMAAVAAVARYVGRILAEN